MIKEVSRRELGAQLGRLAISAELSVVSVSFITGASRTAIYNWYKGSGVTNAYKPIVKQLIKILRTSSKEQLVELKNNPVLVYKNLTL